MGRKVKLLKSQSSALRSLSQVLFALHIICQKNLTKDIFGSEIH